MVAEFNEEPSTGFVITGLVGASIGPTPSLEQEKAANMSPAISAEMIKARLCLIGYPLLSYIP
jgi:hypothetical protein